MTTDELPDNLARALKALDDDAARAAARLDPTHVALGVLERLRTEPAVAEKPARRWSGASLRVAVAAMVLVIGGVIARQLAFTPGADDDSAWVAIYADSIVAAAQATDSVVTVASAVTVDDLNETELRTLLRIMESSEEAQ